MNIIKRDGRIKEFDIERIKNAIQKCYIEVLGEEGEEAFDLNEDILIPNIEEEIKSLNKEQISIEEIQDIIVKELEAFCIEAIPKAYRRYREERRIFRESKHSLTKSIVGLIDHSNIEVMTENSNKQSHLASTQRDLIAGEVSKYIARTQMIPKHIIDANDKGIIKLHDLDYYLQQITNCELVNLKDMLDNGTVINKKMINTPKSLRTAMTLATQISAQISSFTYGGQTMSLSHLAPYVRKSKEKIENQLNKELELAGIDLESSKFNSIVQSRLKEEIKDSVQTFNYQISTLNSTNGQSPFISLAMYISEDEDYEMETAMLIEEFLKQRIQGLKNEYGVVATQTFPKLLYFLDENNINKDSKYYYLTKLAAISCAKRMSPDFISVKKMKEVHGTDMVWPCMGCRSFLSPWKNKEGESQFYGRGNLGVTTINLVHAALSSEGNINKFWNILEDRLENLVFPAAMLRYEKLKGVKANIAPILWCHGAISRLNPDDEIMPIISDGRFSISLGYAGIYETVKYLTGKSHTSKEGRELALQIMKKLDSKTKEWKKRTGLGFGCYGTPNESGAGWFAKKLKEQFGIIKDITDKGFITNSFHVDVREEIDAFSKLSFEAQFEPYSAGGVVNYVEVPNMEKNIEAILQIINHIYNTNIYAEINSESDVCGVCKYSGVMNNDSDTLEWVCPQCGNRDQSKLSVVRRTCGYLSETVWTEGRLKDILSRVKHL